MQEWIVYNQRGRIVALCAHVAEAQALHDAFGHGYFGSAQAGGLCLGWTVEPSPDEQSSGMPSRKPTEPTGS